MFIHHCRVRGLIGQLGTVYINHRTGYIYMTRCLKSYIETRTLTSTLNLIISAKRLLGIRLY